MTGSNEKEQLTDLGVVECRTGLAAGTFSSVDLTQAFLQRIDKVDGRVHAFLRATPEQAQEAAAEADQARADGDVRPLLGIPLAIKDVLMTTGIETTAGSRILEKFVPPYSATAVEKLQSAGAIVLGEDEYRRICHGVQH